MLYLPPRYAHDGIAEGECQTWSIGFRSASRSEWMREIFSRWVDHVPEDERLYADPKQEAATRPAEVPAAMHAHLQSVLQQALASPLNAQRALGEWLTEPKAQVWFDGGHAWRPGQGVILDRRSRMLHDRHHIFLNGESWKAAGADARVLKKLADQGHLTPTDLTRCSAQVLDCIRDWCEAGWLRPE